MPSGTSAEETEARRRRRERDEYPRKANPATVQALVDVNQLRNNIFKGDEWKPAWGIVEFDGDACLKNVTGAGKSQNGFFVPAGSMLPLGAALPEMTVLKYGGYFPAGTSFPGGVLIPLHARMVNLLPQMTASDPKPPRDESLCVVQ